MCCPRAPSCAHCHALAAAGLKGEGLLFLLTDSQIVDEKMLVFVNDLLASGEIPDLFAQAGCLPNAWLACQAVCSPLPPPPRAHLLSPPPLLLSKYSPSL